MIGFNRHIKFALCLGTSGVMTGIVGAHFAHSTGWIRFFDNLHWTAGTAAAAALAWLGRQPHQYNAGYRWFTLGTIGYAAGQIVWDIQQIIGYNLFPSPSDVLYLWLGPCVAMGFLSAGFKRIVNGERHLATLDCAMLVTAALALTLVLYLPKRGDTAFFPMSVLIAYPASLLSALGIGLIMIPTLRLRPTPALMAFLTGLATTSWSWMTWNSLALDGQTYDGAWFNGSFSVAILVMGGAIPYLSFETWEHSVWNRYCEASLRLLPLLAVVIASVAVVAAQVLTNLPPIVVKITWFSSILVIILAVVRQHALLEEHDRLLNTERSLKQERLLSNAIIEGLPGVFLLLDERGTIHKHNSQFRQFINDTRNNDGGLHFYHAIPDTARSCVDRYFQQVLEQGEASFELEFSAPPDRRVSHGFSFIRIVFGDTTYMMGIGINITALKNAMTALEESRNFLQQVLETIPLRIFWKDKESRYRGCNKAFADDAGIDNPADIIGKSDHDLVWQDEAHLYRADDQEVMNTLRPKLLFDERQTTPQGKKVWIRTSKVALRNAREELLGVLGVYDDISERKHLEDLQKLAALVFDHSREAIIVTNAENETIAVNPSFIRVTGYQPEEVLGKNPSLLSSGKQNAEFYQVMWQSINDTGHWEGEIWNKRKNGELYPQRLSISVIRQPDGSIFRHVGIGADITDKKQAEELIWHQANFDALTQLPNRRMLADRMDQELKRAQRGHYPLSVLFIDLDHFKDVNDSLGHQMGDVLLVEAAQRMQRCVRESDTLARLGGDEFAIIILNVQPVDIDRVANSIIAELNAPYQLGKDQAYISASIGISCYPDDGQHTDELLKKADQAMYAAKHSGRCRFSYFKSEMQDAALLHLRLASDMRTALGEGGFELYFQPIIELSTGSLQKAEALLRWQHPQLGFISTDQFITIAENTGFIHELGDWVFSETLNWSKRWSNLKGKPFVNSVNLSPIQLMRGNGIDDWVAQFLEAGLTHDGLVLEITESLLLNDKPDVSAKLLHLREHGMQLSIDDFGTGYSSLSYLSKFPINYLKIDKSFINDIDKNATQRALVEAIIVMAHKLNLRVVAEGVETDAQKQLLQAAECDYAQGYLFSKPIPAQQFEDLFIRPDSEPKTGGENDKTT